MTEPEQHGTHGASNENVSPKTLLLLERLDNIAHVIVAGFFILMAASVLLYAGIIFARQIPLLGQAMSGHQSESAQAAPSLPEASGSVPVTTEIGHATPLPETSVTAHPAPENTEPFLHNSLEMLSTILFAVIVLELLRTIITYLQAHDIQAIMREFLVVGIISSVRKILLVGAESSLSGAKGYAFIQEACGTLLSILGILLLILCLVVLQRGYGVKSTGLKEEQAQ